MIFVRSSELLLAVGWVLLIPVLVNGLDPSAASLIILTTLLAEGLSGMMMPQRDPLHINRASNAGYDLERIFLLWTFIVPGVIAAIQIGELAVYESAPLATLCLVGLCLLLPILKLGERRAGALSFVVPMRLILLALLALGLQKIGVEHVETYLLSAVLLLLTLLLLTFRPFLRAMQPVSNHRARTSVWQDVASLALRQVDLLVLPFVLPPGGVLTYVIARGIGASVTLMLDHLIVRAYRSVASGIEAKTSAIFPVAEAARVNLGVMLVGGAVALALLSALPYLETILGSAGQGVDEIAIWLICGALGPVFFGAAPALLRLAGLQREVTVLCLLSTAVFLTSVAAQPSMTMLGLAQTTAIVQLTTSAAAAFLLACRVGVWPGLTAILFRQIKLF